MTLTEAEAIIALTRYDEILYLAKVQNDIYQQALDSQLQKGLTATIEEVRRISGMIVGVDRCRFKTLLEEANKVVDESMKHRSDGRNEED